MFSYYGSKSKIIKYYPEPLCDTIIEPFAGSAQYALRYWQNRVVLIEKDKRICDIWSWLINEATPDFILSLPLFKQGEKVCHSDSVVQNLMRLECHGGSSIPYSTVGKYNNWSEFHARERIANNLYKIKHWEIIHGDYTSAPDIRATWFIDPPYYSRAGRNYKYGCMEIDYEMLGQWCRERRGQVIVCENDGASWLPFRYLTKSLGGQRTGKKSKNFHWYFDEGIWTNTNDQHTE